MITTILTLGSIALAISSLYFERKYKTLKQKLDLNKNLLKTKEENNIITPLKVMINELNANINFSSIDDESISNITQTECELLTVSKDVNLANFYENDDDTFVTVEKEYFSIYKKIKK